MLKRMRSLFLIAALLVLAPPAQTAERKPPNILFILADDLGWGDLSCYGNARFKTPALDRLAREGTLFTQFYQSSGVWRFAVFGHPWNRSPILAIRDGPWKLLLNPDRSRVELYDIPADPSEQNNVASQHARIVERLTTKALAWQKTLPPGTIESAAGKNDYPMPREAKP